MIKVIISDEDVLNITCCNYNHYNLPFSHIMIIVIISDEDMLYENTLKKILNLNSEFFIIDYSSYYFWFCNEKLHIYF